jgi:hypothetical protein
MEKNSYKSWKKESLNSKKGAVNKFWQKLPQTSLSGYSDCSLIPKKLNFEPLMAGCFAVICLAGFLVKKRRKEEKA